MVCKMAHGRIDDAWPCLLRYSTRLLVFLIVCTAEEKQMQTPLDQNNDQTELPHGPNPLPVLPPVPGDENHRDICGMEVSSKYDS